MVVVGTSRDLFISSHIKPTIIMTAGILRPTISKNNRGPLRLNSEVRSKFFTRIGVVGADLNTCMHQFENADISKDSSVPTRDLQNVPRYSTKLKRDKCDEKEIQAFLGRRRKFLSRRAAAAARAAAADKNSTPSVPAESIPKKSKPKRCISFNESVKVVPIPKRHEYSDRIRSRLWTNTVELYENAGRSHLVLLATLRVV